VKKYLITFSIILLFLSCGNKQKEEYEAFKKGAMPLSPWRTKDNDKIIQKKTDNIFKQKQFVIIELEENPSTGYLWHHKISNKKVLIPFGKKMFDFNEKGTVGGPRTVIWKFKAGTSGKTAVVFKYYRDWEGEKSAISEQEFKLTVQ